MGKVAFYDKFSVTAEIIETFSQMGKDIITFHDPAGLETILSEKRIEIEFVFDINFHEDIRKPAVKYNKPYVIWSFDSGVRNLLETTEIFPLRNNDILFLFNYADYLYCLKNHKQTYYMPFSASDKYLMEPRTSDYVSDVLIVMNTYKNAIQVCEDNFRETLDTESDEMKRKTYQFMKALMEYAVEKHKYIIDRNRMIEFIDEVVNSCGFDPFNESRKGAFCDHFGQVLSVQQREICIRELSETGYRIDIYGDEYWPDMIKNLKNCHHHGMAPYDKLGQFYNSAKININLTQIQNLASIPQRIFHLMASGAFILTNYSEILEMSFKPGVHLETFRTFDELKEKTVYYMKNDDARRKIAFNGYLEFKARHKMSDKLNEIFSKVGESL